MNRRNIPMWLLVPLVAFCAASLYFAIRQRRTAAEQEIALARLEAENRNLRARTEAAAPRPANPATPGKAAGHDERSRSGALEAEMAARVDSMRALSQVKDQLAAAHTSLAELQNRVHELEATAEKLSEENKRLAAAEADLRESLAGSRRIVEAMQVELKGKTERLAALEISARRAAEEMKSAQEKITQFTTWSRDLEDLNRRREVYLSNMMRRYRDLTDQVRSMTLRLGDPQDHGRSQSVDLPRLQNIIQLAEEDLRQLNALNSQASRLAQKMRN